MKKLFCSECKKEIDIEANLIRVTVTKEPATGIKDRLQDLSFHPRCAPTCLNKFKSWDELEEDYEVSKFSETLKALSRNIMLQDFITEDMGVYFLVSKGYIAKYDNFYYLLGKGIKKCIELEFIKEGDFKHGIF